MRKVRLPAHYNSGSDDLKQLMVERFFWTRSANSHRKYRSPSYGLFKKGNSSAWAAAGPFTPMFVSSRRRIAIFSEGRFRSDLYYRLNVFPIHSPSLRQRSDDIPILVDYFISRFAIRMGKRIREVDRGTLEAMQRYSWPGNIRELQNIIERGVILADSEVFRLEAGALPEESDRASVSSLRQWVANEELVRIEAVLKETHGKVAGSDGAAARLGVPASTLESRIKALKIDKNLFRD
jgi:DNA-binding NtrC family response regulator